MTGYSGPAYAATFPHVGTPVALPRSGGFLLQRPIPETALHDAIGTYPFLACRDWEALDTDLSQLEGLVSVVAVPDPLGDFSRETLERAFPYLCRPFKTHYLVDLAAPEARLPEGHRRNVSSARREVDVSLVENMISTREEWARLYASLCARHGIEGVAAFPPAALAAQLEMPGMRAIRATTAGSTVGMALFLARGDDVYYHLGAYTDEGYRRKASFAVFDEAIRHFRANRYRRLLLGSGAGLSADAEDGLSRFKRGWATGEVQSYICGRVCDAGAYARLAPRGAGEFFPAYRAPGPQPLDARSNG